MHGVLTRAEKSLARTDRAHVVNNIRQLFQETMEADSRAAVERLTGHKVVAFISGNHTDPDIEADVFILDTPLTAIGDNFSHASPFPAKRGRVGPTSRSELLRREARVGPRRRTNCRHASKIGTDGQAAPAR